jgi:hypothetical protein
MLDAAVERCRACSWNFLHSELSISVWCLRDCWKYTIPLIHDVMMLMSGPVQVMTIYSQKVELISWKNLPKFNPGVAPHQWLGFIKENGHLPCPGGPLCWQYGYFIVTVETLFLLTHKLDTDFVNWSADKTWPNSILRRCHHNWCCPLFPNQWVILVCSDKLRYMSEPQGCCIAALLVSILISLTAISVKLVHVWAARMLHSSSARVYSHQFDSN